MSYVVLTAQNKTADGGNKARQKGIEWKASHEATINKLNNAGQYNVHQIGVNDFQFVWGVLDIFVVELIEYYLKIGHFGFFWLIFAQTIEEIGFCERLIGSGHGG